MAIFVTILLVTSPKFGCVRVFAQDAAQTQVDINKLMSESDVHFVAVDAGKVSPDKLRAEWKQERTRQEQIAKAIKNAKPSLLSVENNRRCGLADSVLLKGSYISDWHFARAEKILRDLKEQGVAGPWTQYNENLAKILQARISNLVLLDKDAPALLPILQRYVALFDGPNGLKRLAGEPDHLRKEIQRLEKLPRPAVAPSVPDDDC